MYFTNSNAILEFYGYNSDFDCTVARPGNSAVVDTTSNPVAVNGKSKIAVTGPLRFCQVVFFANIYSPHLFC